MTGWYACLHYTVSVLRTKLVNSTMLNLNKASSTYNPCGENSRDHHETFDSISTVFLHSVHFDPIFSRYTFLLLHIHTHHSAYCLLLYHFEIYLELHRCVSYGSLYFLNLLRILEIFGFCFIHIFWFCYHLLCLFLCVCALCIVQCVLCHVQLSNYTLSF